MKTPLYHLVGILSLFIICQIQLLGQNVGIGTSNPNAKLHLQSTIQTNTSLSLDYETGTIDPANNLGDNDWYITGTDGYNSTQSVKAPLIFNSGENALLAYFIDMAADKEITVSFDYKYDDPTNQVAFNISSNGFSYSPASNPDWKFYTTTFTSQSTSDALKISVNALVDEAFPIVHVDNIMITYEDGHVLKIEDGTEADGHFLQSDAFGHTEWYDLRGEVDQKIDDNLQELEFDTTQNALFIEGGNGVLISSLKNDNGKELHLDGSKIEGSPGLSFHLPGSNFSFPSLYFDATNKTMDWGHNPDANKGEFSTRWGNNSTASNAYSTAWGDSNNATGVRSTSWGSNSVAAGLNSTSWGNANWALGENSTSFGNTNTSNAELATSWGYNNQANGIRSTTWGLNNIASGNSSTSWGSDNTASGTKSSAWGDSNEASGVNSTSFGDNNNSTGQLATSWGEDNSVSAYGGTVWGSDNNASFSFTSVWGQGNSATNHRSTAWGNTNQASGLNSTSFGNNNVSSALNSTAYGEDNMAAGENSSSSGDSNTSNGDVSKTWGYNNTVESLRGTAWGGSNLVESTAENGTACGSENTALGVASFVSGLSNEANSYTEVAFGRFNDSPSNGNATTWSSSDLIFSVGNGSSDTDRKNAFTVGKSGNVGINSNPSVYRLNVFNTQLSSVNIESENHDARLYLTSGEKSEIRFGGSFWNFNLEYDIATNCFSMDDVLRIDGSNVGINKMNPSYDLHLGSDDAAKPGTSSWTVSSDRRLKKDITEFTDGLEIISAIEPVWFTYNGLADLAEETYVGTIAQDLEEIAPYMVSEYTFRDDNGNSENYKAVNYGAMDFVLINAIKEQQAIILSQQEAIDELRTEMGEIKSLIGEFRSKIKKNTTYAWRLINLERSAA